MVEVIVVTADVVWRVCDLLILKHADGFHGVDGFIARRVGFRTKVKNGAFSLVKGSKVMARTVMFCGVGPLEEFRYERIRAFAAGALAHAAKAASTSRIICSTLHGTGYGLDEKEAFFSLIGGFLDAIESGKAPPMLERIEIVENNETRAARLSKLLHEILDSSKPEGGHISKAKRPHIDEGVKIDTASDEALQRELVSFGKGSEEKPKLFVAMPFAEEFSDLWEVAIQDASNTAGILSERIAEQSYVGDIFAEIKDRVTSSSGLLAVLDGANPNVFLELGYAWALEKPTVLIANSSTQLPFDVRGQKCIIYKNIGDLRKRLTAELTSLKNRGIFK